MDDILANSTYQEGIAAIRDCITAKGRRLLYHMFVNILTVQIGLVDYLEAHPDELPGVISEFRAINSKSLKLLRLLTEK